MGISPEQLDFERIRGHVGHHVVAVTYGNPPVNAAIECETCGTVLYSADPTTPAAQPVTMWQFSLVQGGVVVQQVLAGEALEMKSPIWRSSRPQRRWASRSAS